MATVRIHLFGKFGAWRDDQAVEKLDARRVQELFCYLILHRDRSHSRETLASLFWGDNPTSLSRKFLRQALWQIQTALHPDRGPSDARIVLVDTDWVQFNAASDVWVDIAEFEESFTVCRQVSGELLDDEQFTILQDAVSLCHADLLEGWYQDWCLYQRERLQDMYLIMLDKLMGYCEARCQYEAGIDYGARVLQLDRARERAHQRLMRLYYMAGDRSAALRQYERCVVALREELGVKPGRGTTVLYEQIRQDQFPIVPATSIQPASTTPQNPLDEVLRRLKQLQSGLGDLQQQVQEEIQIVEGSMQG